LVLVTFPHPSRTPKGTQHNTRALHNSLAHSLTAKNGNTAGGNVKNSKHKCTLNRTLQFPRVFQSFPNTEHSGKRSTHCGQALSHLFRFRFLANIIYAIYNICTISRGGGVDITTMAYIAWPVSAVATNSLRCRSAVELQTRTELRPQLTRFSFSCTLARIFGSERRKIGKSERQDDEARRTPKGLWCAACFSMSPPIFRSEPKLSAGSLRSSADGPAFRVAQSSTADCRQCMRHLAPLPCCPPPLGRPKPSFAP